MKTTKIEWADSTASPWYGCTKVSPGCANCYAEGWAKRAGKNIWGRGKARQKSKSFERDCRSLQKLQVESGSAHHGAPNLKVFPSLCDWLDPEVPIDWLADMLRVMHECQNLDFLVLSKRPELFHERLENALTFINGLITLEVYEETSAKREAGLRSCKNRGTGDRQQRSSVALAKARMGQVAEKSSHQELQKGASGSEECVRIPSSVLDARRSEIQGVSGKVGLASFPGSNTAGIDGKSQERSQGRQQAGELGVGDIQPAEGSRNQSAWSTTSRCSRREPSKDEAEECGCSGNARESVHRGNREVNRGSVQNESKSSELHYNWKNLEALAEWIKKWLNGNPPSNIWIGTSCENQAMADKRIPELLRIPAKVRFLSLEPLLGPIQLGVHQGYECNLYDYGCGETRVDWVIVGGESGPGARPCNVEWIRDIVRQCKAAGVKCFVKQLGSNPVMEPGPTTWPCEHPKGGDPAEWPEDMRVREMPQ